VNQLGRSSRPAGITGKASVLKRIGGSSVVRGEYTMAKPGK